MELKIDETIMVTSRSCQPILTEKAVVELQKGSLWSRVLRNKEPVGIIFIGDARFAVDAITETAAGAVGESIADDLVGFQLVLGNLNIEDVSREANEEDIRTKEIDGISGFFEGATAMLKDAQLKKTKIPSNNGRVLIGHTLTNLSLVLVVNEDKLVLIYRDRTYVISDDLLINVRKNRLRIYGRRGQIFGLPLSRHHGHHRHYENIIDAGIPRPRGAWDDLDSDCCSPHLPPRRVPRYNWHRAVHDWDPDWVV